MTDYSKYKDQELVSLLKRNDELAFAEIYRRYYRLLQNHIYKRLGDLEEIKDILQELFTYIWVKRAELPETTNFSGYLYIIARNKVFNSLAHQKVASKYLQSLEDFIGEENYVTDLTIRENEFRAMIDREIDALPDKMSQVFRLSRGSNLSHKEIAEQLGISEYTASNQVTNALKILRVKLGTFFFLLLF